MGCLASALSLGGLPSAETITFSTVYGRRPEVGVVLFHRLNALRLNEVLRAKLGGHFSHSFARNPH